MDKKTFFTSDQHWGHKNILKYSKRPFATIEEHDEALINNWNSVVSKGDDVYFLGDFALCPTAAAAAIRKRLNGNIGFIEGNHDHTALEIRHSFAWYNQVRMVKVQGQEIFLSHYAHRVWPKSHHGSWHLYGHSHGHLPDDPGSLSIDVGVDCHSYFPISFEMIKEMMAKKTFVPIKND